MHDEGGIATSRVCASWRRGVCDCVVSALSKLFLFITLNCRALGLKTNSSFLPVASLISTSLSVSFYSTICHLDFVGVDGFVLSAFWFFVFFSFLFGIEPGVCVI